ncbi:MAG TPA: hypothetical protein VGO93_04870 [Candidatus Xenobia bacterium]
MAAAKALYLVKMEQAGTIGKARRLAGVLRATVRDWESQDPTFAVAARDAHAEFVDRLETKLIDLATGKKGAKRAHFMGLISLLNAYHPSMGRIRWEMLEKAVAIYLKNITKALQRHVSPDVVAAVLTEVDDLTQSASVAPMFAGSSKNGKE